jgi:hypothetical protein
VARLPGAKLRTTGIDDNVNERVAVVGKLVPGSRERAALAREEFFWEAGQSRWRARRGVVCVEKIEFRTGGRTSSARLSLALARARAIPLAVIRRASHRRYAAVSGSDFSA